MGIRRLTALQATAQISRDSFHISSCRFRGVSRRYLITCPPRRDIHLGLN